MRDRHAKHATSEEVVMEIFGFPFGLVCPDVIVWAMVASTDPASLVRGQFWAKVSRTKVPDSVITNKCLRIRQVC